MLRRSLQATMIMAQKPLAQSSFPTKTLTKSILLASLRHFSEDAPRHRLKVKRPHTSSSSSNSTNIQPFQEQNQIQQQPTSEYYEERQPISFGRYILYTIASGFGFAIIFALVSSLFGGRKVTVVHQNQNPAPQGQGMSQQDLLIAQASQYYAQNPHGTPSFRDDNHAPNYATPAMSSDDLIKQAEAYYASQGTVANVDYSGNNNVGISNTKTEDGKKWW